MKTGWFDASMAPFSKENITIEPKNKPEPYLVRVLIDSPTLDPDEDVYERRDFMTLDAARAFAHQARHEKPGFVGIYQRVGIHWQPDWQQWQWEEESIDD